MTLQKERHSTSSETQRKSLARTAQGYFIQASIDFPACVPAQAVSIALSVRKGGYKYWELSTALLFDKDRLEEIQKAAEKMHLERGKLRIPSIQKIRDVITIDFDEALKLKDVPEEELQRFINETYPALSVELVIHPRQRDAVLQGYLDVLSGNARSASLAAGLRT